MIEQRNPIPVTKEVFDGLEVVRRCGGTNMLDRPEVVRIAMKLGYVETAVWIEGNRKLYAEGIFRGFVVDED